MVACIVCTLSCGLLPCQCSGPHKAPLSIFQRFLPAYFHFRCCSCEKFHRCYELGQELGRGSSGTIRLCNERSTGQKLACKKLDHQQQQQAHLEVELMRQVSGHPNIISLREAYLCSNKSLLVMELCEEGSLLELMKRRTRYSEHQAASLCKSLMEAVQFCHSKGIIHRDITLANILISHSVPKLADFGLAAKLNQGGRLSELVGTTYFVAPEVLEGDYGMEVDVWSSGVVLYAILSGGEVPFYGKTTKSTFSAIMSSPVNFNTALWRKASPMVKTLISGMLCREVERRLTPSQILNHEWIVQHTSRSIENEMHSCIHSDAEGSDFMLSSDNSFSLVLRHFPSPTPNLHNDLLTALTLLLSALFIRLKHV